MHPPAVALPDRARAPITAEALTAEGGDLDRPECVLATAAGDVYTADWRGGVHWQRADGSERLIVAHAESLRPNGIALMADGSFLLAHLGADDGGVWRLQRDGQARPWLLQADGVTLPPTNFVLRDHDERVWVTVSTRRQPRALGYRADVADGFIVCVDASGARIVADRLGYTNEVALDPSRRWLYVNETFARRLSRFALLAGGRLGGRETVCVFGPGTFPDGLAFDVDGAAWVVSIVSNRLIRVPPSGEPEVWLEDADAAHVAEVEAAYREGRMGREHLDRVGDTRLRNISSIAFCGPGRRQALLGCLLGRHLMRVPCMPAAGVAPAHWHFVDGGER